MYSNVSKKIYHQQFLINIDNIIITIIFIVIIVIHVHSMMLLPALAIRTEESVEV